MNAAPLPLDARRRAFRSAFLIASAALLAAHFAITMLFDLPNNPISLRYRALSNAYILPLFSQNWSFFAPMPPTRDDFLIARYRLSATGREPRYTGWVTLSLGLNAEVQTNRFSPIEIVQLMSSNIVNDMNPYFPRFVVKSLSDTKLSRIERFPIEMQMLYREAMASQHVLPVPISSARADAVQIAIVHHFFPRFTQRFAPDDLTTNNTVNYLPWVAFDAIPAYAKGEMGS